MILFLIFFYIYLLGISLETYKSFYKLLKSSINMSEHKKLPSEQD